MSRPAEDRTRTPVVVGALALLYLAQGIPFGFATEYLPVVLREQGYTYAMIAALSWLQLPWQLKVLWARAADHPRVRPRARGLILALQLALSLTVAAFAWRTLREGPALWFALTAVAATVAATQDVFVDAFAVRVLRPEERGFGNTAQVAGYRLGMLVGGATLLLLVGQLGERATLLACAGVVALCSVGAFVGTSRLASPDPAPGPDPSCQPIGVSRGADGAPGSPRATDAAHIAATPGDAPPPGGALALLRHMLARESRVVLALALTFKFGMHMASSLLKPMAVDFGWTKQQIGWAVVTLGSVGALLGASVGGALHRALGERKALAVALAAQALTCVPLVAVEVLHAPIGFTTAVIALEHFGSGLGTTVLFAALMTATRPADAGLHYTILTSANAVAIGLGGLVGALVADHASRLAAFVAATVVCLAPAALLPGWSRACRASSGAT